MAHYCLTMTGFKLKAERNRECSKTILRYYLYPFNMQLRYIQEPELQFGTNSHVCPRVGIREYSVYDVNISPRRDTIYVGAVTMSDDLAQFDEWLER